MTTPTSPISDRAVSYLRTVVPVLWGSAVTWLLTVVVLPTEVTDLLTSDLAITAITALVVGAWYIAWRWAEPHIPDWLTRLVLGSAQTPTYTGRHSISAEYAPPTSGTSPGIPIPSVGRVVRYTSKLGDEVESPALVLRTRASTVPGVINQWGTSPDDTLSGTGRPETLVTELPDDLTVDLLVHGLGGDYREYAVRHGVGPGAWSWPPRS